MIVARYFAVEGVFIMPSGLQPASRPIVALLAQSGRQVDHRARTACCGTRLYKILQVPSSCAREDHRSLLKRAAVPAFMSIQGCIEKELGALRSEKAVRVVRYNQGVSVAGPGDLCLLKN